MIDVYLIIGTPERGYTATSNGHHAKGFIQTTPDPRRGQLQDALDLVVEVIADKQADAATAAKRASNANLRQVLLAAKARKVEDKLSEASIEDIDKQLAALED